MFVKKIICLGLVTMFSLPQFAFGQQEAINRFKEIGMKQSQAANIIRYLTDEIGARLTNSPSQRRASRWTKEQFDKWGLQNSKIDSWGQFGRSWEIKRFSLNVVSPEYIALRVYPKAWSPSTPGTILGNIVFIDAKTVADLAKYRGRLKGAIVLVDDGMKIEPGWEPTATRRSDKELAEMTIADPPPNNSAAPREVTYEQRAQAELDLAKSRLYYEEGVAAMLDSNWRVDSGTIRVMGAETPPGADVDPLKRPRSRPYQKETPATIPQFVVEVEQYNRLLRRVKNGEVFKAEVNLDVSWNDKDQDGYNTIAEIPGTDLKDEVVMIGAHLDSWHSGTGATDNGAGTTVVMEAMRILAASGLKPRRTIRVALWTGEEQGLLGSRAYVSKNFAKRNADGSLNKTKNYEKFVSYFNLDNGTGQIRGIYSQGNAQARVIFNKWLEPFADFRATTTTILNTGGTDHLAFDAVGLPGFQFIQDPIEYSKRTWHTTQDVFDRTLEEDLKRSAVIMATFAYNAATAEQSMPRKPEQSSLSSIYRGLNFDALIAGKQEKHANYAICGHDIAMEEIPVGFPSLFALRDISAEQIEGK